MALYHPRATTELVVPNALQQRGDTQLPHIDRPLLRELSATGWHGLGIMVAVIGSSGVMMLAHHERSKNSQDMLGPLGETSQWVPKTGEFEQPLATLRRGIIEELGVEKPEDLGLSMFPFGGWTINQWPRGIRHPGEFACAMSFPVFVDDNTQEKLIDIHHQGEEVGAGYFMPVDEIMEAPDSRLRPGVKEWLSQLGCLGLTQANSNEIVPVDFSALPLPQDIDVAGTNW